jgi:uncharacterized membrane protein
MVIWAALVGAFAGWLWTELDGFGALLGGIVGAVAGLGLRKAVRAEIERALAGLAPAPVASVRPPLADREPPSREPGSAALPGVLVERAQARAAEQPIPEQPRTTDAPAPPRDPRAPGMVERGIAGVREWLLGGNTVVRLGLVILFVGLSFLVRYAAAAGLFPIELRLAAVTLVGIVLLAFGFRTRVSRPAFGLALQGAGVAVVYLTLFAAVKLVPGFPVAGAFAVMILVCALGCALALVQSSQALAVTAFAGGYATPLLLSDGGGQVAGLFTYFTILNLAVLFIGSRRAWRVLNLLGFFATFGVATMWMASSYRPADFWITQGFVAASVLIYLAAAILFARRTPGRVGAVVDTTLLFGPALTGFGLEVALVGDRPFGAAFAAVGFAALYLGVATIATRRDAERFRILHEAMLAIGIGFVTLAVPLALGARWTSAAWALEGAGAFWVGLRQERWTPRLFGLLLVGVAALTFLSSANADVAALPIANPAFVGAVLIAGALLAIAWWLRAPIATSGSWLGQRYARLEPWLGHPVFLAGFAFWWFAWTLETTRAAPPPTTRDAALPVFGAAARLLLPLLAFVLSAWASRVIARRTDWKVATWPSFATLPALWLAFASAVGSGRHLLFAPDWAIWLVAIGVHVWLLRANDREEESATGRPLLGATHVGGVWLAAAMLADCLWLGVDRFRLWNTLILIALTLCAERASGRRARRWPLDRHAEAFGWFAASPVAALTFGGALLTGLFAEGETAPLPYLPLLNPVDLSLALAVVALVLWRRTVLTTDPVPRGAARLRARGVAGALAGLAFVALNTVWLRFAHQWLGVAWDVDALFADFVVQTGLAILWTAIALVLMVWANRAGRRMPWLAGAGLLGLTVLKLVTVDLNNSGGGARIVAFIGVGALMLVLGYLAPLPSRRTVEEGA